MKRPSINDIITGGIAHLSVCYHSVYHKLLYNKIWHFVFSLRSRLLEVVGAERTGAREGDTLLPSRVSLSSARPFLRPLLPSACYAGYFLSEECCLSLIICKSPFFHFGVESFEKSLDNRQRKHYVPHFFFNSHFASLCHRNSPCYMSTLTSGFVLRKGGKTLIIYDHAI